ncbi:MAG TPA: MFS transporter [Acetobacteraceae bacterium]|jgi:acyl-[acyl-carrier-protein]-phospholipid O-acyltransferase/long-chain-fatty-acid--[acyl-carrier-protein] ligase|nr:MFS transporter [Acetobacteraceae bacterium]
MHDASPPSPYAPPARGGGTKGFALLRTRRFLPLFVTQFLGALNDNLFKNAMVVLALFQAGTHGPVLVAAAGGVFILPFILFASLAGELADRYEKAHLLRLMKWWEVALMVLAAIGFLTGTITGLMLVLFGLGIQATFFSPLKYGIMPDHLTVDEILAGNGYIEASTYVGILLGTIAGAALIRAPGGTIIVSAAGLAVALAGVAAAQAVPLSLPKGGPVPIGWNVPREIVRMVLYARTDAIIWRCVLYISWFWMIGLVLLTQFPVIAKDTLGGDASLVTLLLTGFTVGIGAGSMLCPLLLHGEVSARLTGWAALGISLFTWDFATAGPAAGAMGVTSVAATLTHPAGWRLLFDLFAVSFCGGVFSVPLYAIVQERAAPNARARVIASINVMNAVFMVAASVIAGVLAAKGMSAPAILHLLAAVNLPLAIGLLLVRWRRLPHLP